MYLFPILSSCSCFISDTRIQYGIFLAPLFLIILFNLVIFVMVARVLIKHSRKNKHKESKKNIVNTVKTLIGIVSIMLTYGLSWLFGALSVDQAAVVFQWLFVIFSTSQGFMLFIFFCVIGKDAREEWRKLLSCYKYQGESKSKPPQSVTSTAKKAHNYGQSGTGATYLTSRTDKSDTLEMSVDDYQKRNLADLDSSIAPLEMDEYKINTISNKSKEDKTNLIFSNNHVDEGDSSKVDPQDSQLPPQILFRLKRPYFDLTTEKSASSPNPSVSPDLNSPSLSVSPDLNSPASGIDMDEYGELNDYFDDEYDNKDYETDSSYELDMDNL